MRTIGDASYRGRLQKRRESAKFGLEREGGDSAEKHSPHKNEQPESNLADGIMRQRFIPFPEVELRASDLFSVVPD